MSLATHVLHIAACRLSVSSGHSRFWQLLATRNHGFAKLSHSGPATELGNRIWLFVTTFCAFHNVIAHMKCLQLNCNLFRGDVTLSLKLYIGGLSGAMVVNLRTTAFGELLWANLQVEYGFVIMKLPVALLSLSGSSMSLVSTRGPNRYFSPVTATKPTFVLTILSICYLQHTDA
jgi:hypothetical protein